MTNHASLPDAGSTPHSIIDGQLPSANEKSVLQNLADDGTIKVKVSTANTSNPPTDAELDAVTDAQNQRDGCMVFVDDAGGHANAYLCIHDGTKWWQLTMTACA